MGLIADDNPIINKILNIFEPNIFPRAISSSPLMAATTDVTSSDEASRWDLQANNS